MGLENRRQHRIGVALEVRIRGNNRDGLPFQETTHSHDVSSGGCSVETTHELRAGSELEIEIYRHVPGPRGTAPFLTKGVVIRIGHAEPGRFTIAVRFTGPQFPTFRSETTSTIGS